MKKKQIKVEEKRNELNLRVDRGRKITYGFTIYIKFYDREEEEEKEEGQRKREKKKKEIMYNLSVIHSSQERILFSLEE